MLKKSRFWVLCQGALTVTVLIGGMVAASPLRAGESAFIGMQVQGISKAVAIALGYDKDHGVLVRDVYLGGPANKGGVQRGDLILKFAGTDIDTFERLVMTVKSLSAGADVPITLLRLGKIHEVSIKTEPWSPAWNIKSGEFASFPEIGVTVAALTAKIRERFALRWGSNGIIITLIDPEKSEGLDLARGQLIHQINQKPVWDPRQLTEMYKEAQKQGRRSLLLLIEDNKGFHFSILKVK